MDKLVAYHSHAKLIKQDASPMMVLQIEMFAFMVS